MDKRVAARPAKAVILREPILAISQKAAAVGKITKRMDCRRPMLQSQPINGRAVLIDGAMSGRTNWEM